MSHLHWTFYPFSFNYSNDTLTIPDRGYNSLNENLLTLYVLLGEKGITVLQTLTDDSLKKGSTLEIKRSGDLRR
ncbi:uncharacterized protein LACBIDRAFT_318096 [Laccaria bicolor S238N-H82]|uniref:Predicted protein n=1 Tax=Laccaria bicolor (strain S238N-H82 / ATCC MYA-4686) TaxID=486041 RepID=B0D5Z4_LACBS|nr:uncharacterized protein LACBIDRAFT_318096 [Laccaria bicolor S238N-H82]EDR09853.1 predicted protein [Laccaria bicolor S238N-H82]|eukprot:XP_001879238.1 predicted protein [Laccaria bicolor S238N-H82]